MWCGQVWSSVELVGHDELVSYRARWSSPRSFRVSDHLVIADPHAGQTRIDDPGRTHTPALPVRWPRCPLCEAVLHRFKGTEWWVCEARWDRRQLTLPDGSVIGEVEVAS